MNLRQILLKKFLPFAGLFLLLSIISLSDSVQKAYYPLFENFTISSLNNALTDTYFKAKPKQANTDFDYDNIAVLFQSKRVLTSITEQAKKRNMQAQYRYKGFNLAVGETFIAPLTFFICLLIFSPGSLKNKAIALVLGTAIIMGFAYLIVYFKGLYMVSKSGVRDLTYSQNDINFFQLMHFFFGAVTIVTVVLLTWILVTFRKSDLKKFLEPTIPQLKK